MIDPNIAEALQNIGSNLNAIRVCLIFITIFIFLGLAFWSP